MKWQVMSFIGVITVLTGCGKQSSLEGKITDARGQPLSEIKIIAEQTQPVSGYERFEVMTGKDGVFLFGKLHPDAEYTLSPASDLWVTEDRRIRVDSAADGQKKTLPEAISFRFKRSGEGVVTDSKGQLEWFVGSAEAKTWEEAKGWVSGLSIGGGDWRMPASEELKSIQTGEDDKKPAYEPVFKIDNCVWSNEQKSSKVWVDDGYAGPRYYGPHYWGPRYYGPRGGHWETKSKGGKCRGIAVRAAKL